MGVVPVAAIIMGSQSDWETMKHAADMLEGFGIKHESLVISAPSAACGRERSVGLLA